MNRLSFRERMKQYKLARESNPLLKYWEWKEIPRYGDGTAAANARITKAIAEKRAQALLESKDRELPTPAYKGGKRNPQTAFEFQAQKTALLADVDKEIKTVEPYTTTVVNGRTIPGQMGFNQKYIRQYGLKSADDVMSELQEKRRRIINLQYSPTIGGALGSTCLATSTSFYGPEYIMYANSEFVNTPASKSGFKEIPIKDVEPSDIVIRTADNGNMHAMMFNRYDENGERRYNHSNGGYEAENMRKDAKYPAREDQLRAFRYTGTHQDSIQWAKPKQYRDGTDGITDDSVEPNNSLYLGKSGTMDISGKPAYQDALGNWSIYYNPNQNLEDQNIWLPEVSVKPSGENYWHLAGKQFGNFVKDAAYFAPGLGVGMNIVDAYNAEMEGDHAKAAILGGMSVLPMLGKASQFGLLTAGRFGNSWARAKLISDAIVPKTGIGERLIAPAARKINKAWDEKVRFPYMQYKRHVASIGEPGPFGEIQFRPKEVLHDLVLNKYGIPKEILPDAKETLEKFQDKYRGFLQYYQDSPLYDPIKFQTALKGWSTNADGYYDPLRAYEIKRIFNEDPRYFDYVAKFGGNPLDLKTVDAFIKKLFRSVRGARSYTDEYFELFPEHRGDEMNYPSDRSIGKILTENSEGHTGGDRLGTNATGIYTSNSSGIMDTFQRPFDAGRGDVVSTAAILEFPYENDTNLPIILQLRNARGAIYDYDLMPHNDDLQELAKLGYVAKQAVYSNRFGQTIPAFERAYFGSVPNKKLLNIVNSIDSRGLQNKGGRWGFKGFESDEVLESQLFAGANIGYSSWDYERAANTVLKLRKPVDNPEFNKKVQEIWTNHVPIWLGQDFDRGLKKVRFTKNRQNLKDFSENFAMAGMGIGTFGGIFGPIIYGLAALNDPEYNEFIQKYNIDDTKIKHGRKDKLLEILHDQGVNAALNYVESVLGSSYENVTVLPERKSKGGIIGYDGGSDGIPYQPHSEIQWYRDKDGKLRLRVTPGNGFLSAADPVSQAYLEGVALGPIANKLFRAGKDILKKGVLKLLPKTANKALANTAATTVTDVPLYDIASDESKALIDNTFATGINNYTDYLNSQWARKLLNHIYNSGEGVVGRKAADDYALPISTFKMKASVKTPEKPYGQFNLNYEAGDGSAIAATPWTPGKDFTLYDGYMMDAVDQTGLPRLYQIAGHEASHWLDKEVGYNADRFLEHLADKSNMLNLKDWTAKMKAAGRFIDKTDDQIANYYNYLTRPTEVKAYLSEIPRTNFVNGMEDLMPYKNFEEMQEAAKGMSLQVGDILNLYADKQKAFNNLKRLLWSSPSLMMLNKKNKSN